MSKQEKSNRLEEITSKIKSNTANLKDYEEFESILIESGYFTKNDIDSYLKKANLTNYKELIDERERIQLEVKKRNYNILDRRKIVEGIAVVGLLALGISVGIWLSRKTD